MVKKTKKTPKSKKNQKWKTNKKTIYILENDDRPKKEDLKHENNERKRQPQKWSQPEIEEGLKIKLTSKVKGISFIATVCITAHIIFVSNIDIRGWGQPKKI